MIGSLLRIGSDMHVVVDRFWVGFKEQKRTNIQKEYYYEIFSMGGKNGKKRHAINFRDFAESIEKGHIKVLSSPNEP